jgi:Protein of unknown function (DUF2591)
MKTSELTDAALDWAVTKCMGYNEAVWRNFRNECLYSSDWAQGGPIIEREGISVMLSFRDSYAEGANAKPSGWCARKYQYGVLNEPLSHGPTPLIAAMRCYVASKLGDEVDVPEELKC